MLPYRPTSDVTDHGLPTIIDVDVLDPNELVPCMP
jgi:hypothetical protein